MKKNVKISIVIPVYNVQKYLPQCLDSLVNQTLKDIEIICINDGSTDSSLEILNNYAQKDSRIVVINKENEGQGIARNIGINRANGKYIGFVDPDDWVDLDMFEKMYCQAENLQSEIVICDLVKYQEWNDKICDFNFFKEVISINKSKNLKVLPNQNLDKEIINNSLLVSPCYCCNKIYKLELLKENDIKFSNARCYEDCIFILKSFLIAKNISYINFPFYKYRLRKDSTVRSFSARDVELINTFKTIENYLKSTGNYDKLSNNFEYFCTMGLIWLFEKLTLLQQIKFLFFIKNNVNSICFKAIKHRCIKIFLKNLFSITNIDNDKIISILGFKIRTDRYKFKKPIDIVYCWVDGNDENWHREKIFWQQQLDIPVTDAINPCRFIDNEELRYSLRSVAKNLPWINHIYIITNGQVPKWLDKSNSKITIINHKEIMPPDALPTFSAYSIETCLANIPNLSEYFLYANDDFFVYRHVSPDYFFDKSGKPILRFIKQRKNQTALEKELYLQNIVYCDNLICQKFGKYYPYETTHNIDSYRKSYFLECRNFFKNEFETTCYSKFSRQHLIQRTIVNFYMIAKKSCKIKITRTNSVKTPLENIYIPLFNPIEMDRRIQKHKKKLKLFCINDNEKTLPEDRKNLKEYLEFLFPNKQEWEKDISDEN